MKKLVSVRPVICNGIGQLLAGEPFVANHAGHEKELLKRGKSRFRLATGDDVKAWAARLDADPALAISREERAAAVEAAAGASEEDSAKGGKKTTKATNQGGGKKTGPKSGAKVEDNSNPDAGKDGAGAKVEKDSDAGAGDDGGGAKVEDDSQGGAPAGAGGIG